jgi:hypothetical protein
MMLSADVEVPDVSPISLSSLLGTLYLSLSFFSFLSSLSSPFLLSPFSFLSLLFLSLFLLSFSRCSLSGPARLFHSLIFSFFSLSSFSFTGIGRAVCSATGRSCQESQEGSPSIQM